MDTSNIIVLGEHTKGRSGLAKNARNIDEENGTPTPVISLGDLNDGAVASSTELEQWVIRADVDVEGYRVRDGDILIAARGYQFKVARVTGSTEGAIASSNLAILRPRDRVIGMLIFAFLLSPRGQYIVESLGRSSAGRFSVSLKDLRGIEIPLPSPSEQEQLAELIEVAEEQFQVGTRALRLSRNIAREIVWQEMGH